MCKKDNIGLSEFYFQTDEQVEKDYLIIVGKYIEYYHYRAKKCKTEYYGLSIVKYVALAAIPVIQSFGGIGKYPWIAAVASSVCLLIESILKLWKTEEKWILYRSTSNTLMSEQRQYVTKKGKYFQKEDCLAEFVENVECIVDDEARRWIESFQTEQREKTERID
ncbi:DUF4231 domain-containing protein [Ruminococcus sp. AF45-4BH]|nr:DUF4231 domain-containing protein [Ruminococcus sp. AF45-4BH]